MNISAFNSIIISFTDLGDGFLLTLIVAVSSCYFIVARLFHEAAVLVIGFAAVAFMVILLKIVFLSCGNNLWNISSPSGHAALSLFVYGCLGLVAANNIKGQFKYFPFILLFALASFISVTRVMINAHTIPETMLGMGIGLIALALVKKRTKFSNSCNSDVNVRMHRFYFFLGIVIAIIILTQGIRLPAEGILKDISYKINRASYCL